MYSFNSLYLNSTYIVGFIGFRSKTYRIHLLLLHLILLWYSWHSFVIVLVCSFLCFPVKISYSLAETRSLLFQKFSLLLFYLVFDIVESVIIILFRAKQIFNYCTERIRICPKHFFKARKDASHLIRNNGRKSTQCGQQYLCFWFKGWNVIS